MGNGSSSTLLGQCPVLLSFARHLKCFKFIDPETKNRKFKASWYLTTWSIHPSRCPILALSWNHSVFSEEAALGIFLKAKHLIKHGRIECHQRAVHSILFRVKQTLYKGLNSYRSKRVQHIKFMQKTLLYLNFQVDIFRHVGTELETGQILWPSKSVRRTFIRQLHNIRPTFPASFGFRIFEEGKILLDWSH